MRAESDGDQGVSDLGYERTQEARDLLSYLQASSRPPLLRATLAVAVAAPDRAELEQRVETCRRAYGEVRLHRPLGDQLQLFLQHLPGQRTRVAGYDDTLTTGAGRGDDADGDARVGSRGGFYLGHTLSGSRQPVRFNLREGSDGDRNTTILSVGALGSGKTTLDQKLKYEGFLLGARVIDCDPEGRPSLPSARRGRAARRGDDAAPRSGAARHARSAAGRARAPAPGGDRSRSCATCCPAARSRRGRRRSSRRSTASSTRAPRRPAWRSSGRCAPATSVDAQVARTLEVYARVGPRPSSASPIRERDAAAGRQRAGDLPADPRPAGPEPGIAASEYSQAERVGEQIVRLIAMFAMHLMGSERERLKVFSFDEGWRLLPTRSGAPCSRRCSAWVAPSWPCRSSAPSWSATR